MRFSSLHFINLLLWLTQTIIQDLKFYYNTSLYFSPNYIEIIYRKKVTFKFEYNNVSVSIENVVRQCNELPSHRLINMMNQNFYKGIHSCLVILALLFPLITELLILTLLLKGIKRYFTEYGYQKLITQSLKRCSFMSQDNFNYAINMTPCSLISNIMGLHTIRYILFNESCI